MKSRISFFDKTVIRKDITRFMPLWLVYFVCGTLVMLVLTIETRPETLAQGLDICIGLFSCINLVYALLAAQLLFGDLYNSRLCNALHAMPLRRETWFFSHVASGLLFSLVPNAVGILVTIPVLGKYWYAAFFWLLGMEMHYLFFFALAVFCVLCTGSRIAGVVIYGILNFFVFIIQWLLDTIYLPMLYGVVSDLELMILFCPVAQLVDYNDNYLHFEWVRDDVSSKSELRYLTFGEPFGYLAILVVLGIAFGAAALVLYRRRKLESAGDFVTVSWLKPVFAVLFTLCVGSVFTVVGEFFDAYALFLTVGMLLGWFVAQMLLQRTVKVLHKKTLLGLGALALAMVVSLGVTALDPMGISRYVPRAEDVKSVSVTDVGYLEPNAAQLEKVLQLHEAILKDDRKDNRNIVSMNIRYTLTDGRRIERTYTVDRDNAAIMEPLSQLATMPETVLGCGEYPDWETFKKRIPTVVIYGDYDETIYSDKAAALLDAIKADCEQGTMGQAWLFHNDDGYYCELQLLFRDGSHGNHIIVYTNATNTVRWLRENMGSSNTDSEK